MPPNGTKQNVGWIVALSLIGVISSLVGIGVVDMRTRIGSIDDKMDSFMIAIALVESNRFTAQEGKEVWKAIADLRGTTLPPETWRLKINNNTTDIRELQTIVGSRRSTATD